MHLSPLTGIETCGVYDLEKLLPMHLSPLTGIETGDRGSGAAVKNPMHLSPLTGIETIPADGSR